MRAPSVPDGRHLACDEYWEFLHRTTPRPLAFRATNGKEWEAWRSALREKLQELLGLPRPRVPLNGQILETVDCGPFVRHRVVYDTEPHVSVTAYLLVPKKPGRKPGLLCLHGHAAAGKDIVAGVSGWNLRQRRSIARFNKDIGVRFASQGFVCLCPDARGWGERSDGYFRRSAHDSSPPFGGRRDPCNVHFLKAQMFGLNLQGLNTWDDLRGLDCLASRPEVDPSRLGAVGFSYGGTRAMFAAALDERLVSIDISSYLSSFLDYGIRNNETCGAQVVPGILNWCELADVAALIAPRALLCESGERDAGFPIEAARRAFAVVRRCYEVAGAPEACEHEVFRGGHMFAAGRAFDFMNRWLRDRSPSAS
jgi:dienelactone hydrolase